MKAIINYTLGPRHRINTVSMMENTLPDAMGDAKDSLLSRFLSSDHDNDGSNMVAEDHTSSPVLEDDMLLGAEAGHLTPGRRPEIARCKGKMTHMDSTSSDGSRYSIDQLLQDRRPDPEQMLRNLGFAPCAKSEAQCRVPVRFLREPSLAKGICLDDLMQANHELKECVEASRRLMSLQGTGAHLMAGSFKSITHRMRLIGRFASHKTPAQNPNAAKPAVLPVELTSPDGKYKYMTILDPENAQYLARQGHYHRVSRHRLKWPKAMPNLQSSMDDPSVLPDDVTKTKTQEPLKPSVDVSNKIDVKHELVESVEEIALLNTPLNMPLVVIESNKENVDLQLDINSNLPAQPVAQSSWQPAGCLIRPIAPNRGALLTQILHRSYSDKSCESAVRATGMKTYSKSMDGMCSLRQNQDRDGVYNIAKEGLDIRLELSDVETDEQSSVDVQADDSAGEVETSSDGHSLSLDEHGISLDGPRISIDRIGISLDKNIGAGSLTGDDDRGESCVTCAEIESATQRRDREGTEQHTTQEGNRTDSGRLFVPIESNWKELLNRRTNWRASPNFTSTHVETEEAAMAMEGLQRVEGCTEDQDGSRRVPLLHDNGSQQPSFELEEIESDEDVVDETLPVFKREMVKGSLVRTGSGQSDSSGFVEFAEESEVTASFARVSSDDYVLGSFGCSSDSSCTLCGSSEHERQSSLERARRISQNSDHTHSTTSSSGVATATTNLHDDGSGSNVIDATVSLSDNQTNVESKDTVLLDNDLSEVSTVQFSVSAEMSTTTDDQLSCSHASSDEFVSICESSVTDSQSNEDTSDDHRQKSLSSSVDNVMSACSLVEDDNIDTVEDNSLISQSNTTAGNDDEDKRLQSCLLAEEIRLARPEHLVVEATNELDNLEQIHLTEEDKRLQACLLAEEIILERQQRVVSGATSELENIVKEDIQFQPCLLAEELRLTLLQHLVVEATRELGDGKQTHLVQEDKRLQSCLLAEEISLARQQDVIAEETAELQDGYSTHPVKGDRLQPCLLTDEPILVQPQHVIAEATRELGDGKQTHIAEDKRLQSCLLAEELILARQQDVVTEAELDNLQHSHLVKGDKQLQSCLLAEESTPAQPQHVVAEAKQLQEHLVDEVKQVQQAVLRYRLSLQVLETQSSQTYTSRQHDCGEFRDELCNLQALRGDIYQEVTELERLLATRMELAAEGVDIHLHASRSNHQHIVLPTIELLKEQTYHRSITDTIASQQLMVSPPAHGDMKDDTTDSEIAESRLRPGDDVAPSQMMFGLAMEELKTSLLAEIRSTIRSEMAPLTLQMQVLGDRLTRLESAITNGQLVAPRGDTEGDDVDHGIT